MIGLKKTIKDMGRWKNGGMPANKLSPSVSRLVERAKAITESIDTNYVKIIKIISKLLRI